MAKMIVNFLKIRIRFFSKILKFLVTPVGCGIAGYTPDEMAPMFKDAAYLSNVYLPISFWKVLMGNNI